MASFLVADEFIIITDEMCQLALQGETQFKYIPSTLYVTNRRVYVKRKFEDVKPSEVAHASVESTELTTRNDMDVLKVKSKSRPLFLLLPERDNLEALGELLVTLSAAAKRDGMDCDSLSLSLQRRFNKCQGSLSAFYQQLRSNQDSLLDGPPVDAAQADARSSLDVRLLRAIDLLADLIDFDERLPLGLLLVAVCLLSALFRFVPFAVVLCGALFLAMMRYGFALIFSKTPWRRRLLSGKSREEADGAGYLESYEEFADSFRKRFLWRRPRYTLETVVFLLTTAAMFAFCDSAFVLAISLVGLAFVERWNPVGFGSISEIASNLFAF